jgi:GNAT superfamily N-acetyltransferase
MSAPSVRLLTPADADRAGHVLAQAFLDDPLNVHLFPDSGRRKVQTPPMYHFLARFGIGARIAWGVGEPLAAVGLWSAPDSPRTGLRLLLQSGGLRLAFSPLIWRVPRAARIFGQAGRMQKQYAPEPHLYLEVLGTAPEAQGSGFGAALVRAMIAKADRARLPIYTETMTPRNVAWYEHFGFEVMEHYRPPNSDLNLWGFKRPATAD